MVWTQFSFILIFSIIKKQLSIFYDFKVIIVKDINDVFNTV